ncbi:MAG: FAD-binding monooxygenase [Acidobacteria bacterium]|nr:FAD-binding monooxygenase [Acidobacteriota bacterium]
MNNKVDRKDRRALVIGGSISGLFAARVLSDFYDEVIIVERDSLTRENSHRRGVPQSRHAHGLLAGGSDVLEEMFPGIKTELLEAGAVPADVANDGRWFFEGACLRQAPSTTIGLLLSRPLLESVVRGRVRNIDNVTIRENRSVRHLFSSGGHIKAVRTDDETIAADLVVDASGRGSRSLKWLESLRFPAPREERVEIDISYTTRIFSRRESDLNGDLFGVVPATLKNSRSGVILAQENGRWVVTLIGRFGAQAPEDIDGFLAFAKNLEAPFIYNAIRNAEPIGNAMTMKFPASVRRRYERLSRIPKGFLVFGDAICSFNPVYGQGMSVAAMLARTLREELSKGENDLARRFYKAASKVIDTPWALATGNDLKIPETKGKRTLGGKIMGWYVGRLHRLAHHDSQAAFAFLRVAQLLDEPSILLRPGMVLRVLTAGFRGRSERPRPIVARDATSP